MPSGGGLEILEALAGTVLYLKSPNGHYWRIQVSDLGAITTTDTGTAPPTDGVVPPTPT